MSRYHYMFIYKLFVSYLDASKIIFLIMQFIIAVMMIYSAAFFSSTPAKNKTSI